MSIEFVKLSTLPVAELYGIEQLSHRYPWSQATLASCLGSSYQGEALKVDGVPVGYYITHTVVGEATLMNICLLPDMRGQGLGRRLLQRCLDTLLQQQAECCFLEVRASNESALALYRNIGFAQLSRRKGYYPTDNGREDAVIMSYRFHQ
ncbi:ribosomal-protein-alanine N-acetyltransferase [Ferrimonas sediminum]|uniref:[Ribosomal protein bS18]-alanine N-acetyltransferase n=1 Tax=Ferrimonas sediminum TaxID=718193 RepID=A0A1G8QLU1_9GAMM|nr:ribosomal protein S18-alanine N-acetyltransferase [Ferrimonas sediminum]SDJ05636.1 ribosomal-protein-alanine N-acetyltransferase [Ferrimonas sediminum]